MRLSKFATPHCDRLLYRKNVSRLLSTSANESALWLTASAGAGKTSAVGCHLSQSANKTLWYQLDQGDRDPAAFFYYLSQAVANRLPDTSQEAYPALTPEYIAGLEAFARRFFARLFLDLPEVETLVFDEVDHLDETSPLHQVFLQAIEAVPDGRRIIFIGRTAPPSQYARVLTHGSLRRIDAEKLRLSADELRQLVALQGGICDDACVDSILERTGGWFAGATLLLRAMKGGRNHADSLLDAQTPLFFSYFSSEIFALYPDPVQQFLVSIAFLPHITPAIAMRVSGQNQVPHLLHQLSESNQFITCYHSDEGSYRLHPLFRDFLRQEAQQRLGAKQYKQLLKMSAAALVETGYTDEAGNLLIASNSWNELAALAQSNAAELLAQGRNQLLSHWFSHLPSELFDHHPWLYYWDGSAAFPFDMARCRQQLVMALERFRADGNREGIFRSWAAIVQRYTFAMEGFREFDHWISLYRQIEHEFGYPAGEPYEADVATAMFSALSLRRPYDTSTTSWAQSSRKLSEESRDLYRLSNHLFLEIFFTATMGRWGEMIILQQRVQELYDQASSSPLHTLLLSMADTMAFCIRGYAAEAESIINSSLQQARDNGLLHFVPLFSQLGCLMAAYCQDTQKLSGYLDMIRPIADQLPPWDSAIYSFNEARLAFYQGHLALAKEHINTALAGEAQVGLEASEVYTRILASQIHSTIGDAETAQHHLNFALQHAQTVGSPLLLFYCQWEQAITYQTTGDSLSALELLPALTSYIGNDGYLPVYTWRPSPVAELLNLALEHGFERTQLQDFIAHHRIAANEPSQHWPLWPRELSIHALGSLEIVHNGVPLEFGRKVPRKPLELLKWLVVAGPAGTTEDRCADMLWPDAEGDAARRSLATTLHRLRKLLGNGDTVQHADGRLRLHSMLCYVDAWHLDGLVRAEDVQPVDHAASVLALLDEPLLAGDGQAWILAQRHSLLNGLLHFLLRIDPLLRRDGHDALLIALWKRYLNLSPDGTTPASTPKELQKVSSVADRSPG